MMLPSVPDSTVDKCTNCAKGFKITNQAYDIEIKIRVRGILKISVFVRSPIWLSQTKVFH